jgi:hypothetical protein
MRTPPSFYEVIRGLEELGDEFDSHGTFYLTPKCYVSGPMRGIPRYNYDSFKAATKLLREAGWEVFSPQEKDENLGIDPPEDGVTDLSLVALSIGDDLKAICKSNAVFVLPGWEWSEGALLEVEVAHRIGVPVYTFLNQRKIEAPERAPHEFSSRALSGAERKDAGDGYLRPRSLSAPESAIEYGPSWRSTHEPTGGQKGRREAVFATIPIYALTQEARVHGHSIRKYPDAEQGLPNWRLGVPWSWFYDAAFRHLLNFWAGESLDPESELHALAHVRWMCAALMEHERLGLGVDDRIHQLSSVA